MSARFYVGQSPGGHALRVMKDAADNPATTPRTDYEKFAFDSESGNLAYAHGVGAPPDINALSYAPMVTTMIRYEADWWSIFGGSTWRRNTPAGADWNAFETMASGRVRRNTVTGVQSVEIYQGTGISGDYIYGPHPAVLESRTLAWSLPGDETANPFPDGNGTIKRFYRRGNQVRLPRPGFEIDDPNVNNFILHENNRPAKLIRSGRLTIPAGQTVDIQIPPEYDSGLVVGGVVGADGASQVVIPALVTGSADYRDAQVRFMGNGVLRFREKNGRATYLAYYVVAEDGSVPTTGGGSFLRSYGSGSDAYMQMCRPGSGDPPHLSDIMLDSRWGTMPIIAEGFVPKSSFSTDVARQATVTFPDQGYVPLVLVSWIRHSATADEIETYPGQISRIAVVSVDFGVVEGILGQTSVAQVTTSSLMFEHYFGSFAAGINPPNGMPYDSSYFNTQFIGVRYWVFAVPQS